MMPLFLVDSCIVWVLQRYYCMMTCLVVLVPFASVMVKAKHLILHIHIKICIA